MDKGNGHLNINFRITFRQIKPNENKLPLCFIMPLGLKDLYEGQLMIDNDGVYNKLVKQ